MPNTYTEPVSRLLTFGATDWREWDDYSQFGFTTAHVPELILMGTDRHLLIDDVDEEEAWAPVHAWRVLALMQAVESLVPLAQVFDWSEESESDLINECLSNALESFGELAFAPLEAFINQPDHQSSGYISSANVIGLIGVAMPELRERAVQIITSALDAHFERNDKDVNGFWLADLLDLEAVESYPVIKKVFEAGMIDVHVAGDLEDVEIEFGMREERETPPPPPLLFPEMFRDIEIKAKPKKNNAKEKNKNKQTKKSRKKNRKKK